MPSQQGSLDLLESPVAQALLQSTEMAQLAYVWTDGTPRVVPIWFHWDGQAFVMGTPPTAPKVKALRQNPAVALTINSTQWPYKTLLVRGEAAVEVMEGVVPEYAASARRYFGPEQGEAWAGQVGQMSSEMARIVVRPQWVGTLNFEDRWPSAIEAAMESA